MAILKNLIVPRTPHDVFMGSLKGLKFRYGGIKHDRLSFEHDYNILEIMYNGATGGIDSIIVEDLSDQNQNFLKTVKITPELFFCHFYEIVKTEK